MSGVLQPQWRRQDALQLLRGTDYRIVLLFPFHCAYSSPGSPAEPQLTRHFNTTRALKSVNDSSTIDFAYMPQFELDLSSNEQQIRVPLLPDNYYPTRKSAALQEAIEPVMRPEISVMSGETAHIAGPSAMSEVVDNHAMDLDPYDLTSKVHTAASKIVGVPVEKLNEPGVLTELWNGLLDDLLGKRASKA